jgi:hypothetical protein
MHTLFISYIQNFDNSGYIGNKKKTSNIVHPILTPEYRHLFFFLEIVPLNLTGLKANTWGKKQKMGNWRALTFMEGGEILLHVGTSVHYAFLWSAKS